MAADRTQTSYIMVKPDGVQRGLVGEIISRWEKRGFKLVGLKEIVPTVEQAKKHYAEHEGKPFFQGLIDFLTSGPVVCMAWQGANVITVSRKMMGCTKPAEADPCTIRGMYGLEVGRNVIHGSDSEESAKRELAIWFTPEEIVNWEKTMDKHLYE